MTIHQNLVAGQWVGTEAVKNISPSDTNDVPCEYAFVRHPGYVGALLMFAGIALALASWWAPVPAALAGAVLVLRTSWEDALLQAGLEGGYADYARRVRFRLVPEIW